MLNGRLKSKVQSFKEGEPGFKFHHCSLPMYDITWLLYISALCLRFLSIKWSSNAFLTELLQEFNERIYIYGELHSMPGT
jgi:hypothetical protein